MKLKDAYLCVECQEVFTHIHNPAPYNRYPICPLCSNKNNLNLSRILNRRKEDFDEKYNKRNFADDYLRFDIDSKFGIIEPNQSGGGTSNTDQPTVTSVDQDRLG